MDFYSEEQPIVKTKWSFIFWESEVIIQASFPNGADFSLHWYNKVWSKWLVS